MNDLNDKNFIKTAGTFKGIDLENVQEFGRLSNLTPDKVMPW
jgi:hypothetical protein